MVEKIPADKLTLVYVDLAGNEHRQPLPDLWVSGGLIDPETGDDMYIAYAEVSK